MKGSYIDRMYVDPTEWRKAWGTRLVELAKTFESTSRWKEISIAAATRV